VAFIVPLQRKDFKRTSFYRESLGKEGGLRQGVQITESSLSRGGSGMFLAIVAKSSQFCLTFYWQNSVKIAKMLGFIWSQLNDKMSPQSCLMEVAWARGFVS